MNTNRKITVAITSCLLITPAVLAGAWMAGCKIETWRKWDQNTGFNNNQKAEDIIPMCVIPGYYYSEQPNLWVPACTGKQYSAGFCDSKSWGWHCDYKEAKGWGTERTIKGDCYKEFNADGTERLFYVPCTNIRFWGEIKTVRAQCDGK